MKPKGIFITILIVFVLVLVNFSISKNKAMEKLIELDNLAKVTATTQMTSPPKHVTIRKNDWNDLLHLLNSMSLKEIKKDKEKGWEYLFRFEYEDNSTVQISLLNGTVIIGDTVYKASNYNTNDFKPFFE